MSLSNQEKVLKLEKLMLMEYDFRKTISPHILKRGGMVNLQPLKSLTKIKPKVHVSLVK
jgi:hypothetical protein